MKLHSQGHDGMQHIMPHEWGPAVRIRSFHVEFPEDEETPVTHTLSFQRDFVRRDGGLNLEHRFRRSGGYVEFLINDRFHAILALRWLPLVALVFITVVVDFVPCHRSKSKYPSCRASSLMVTPIVVTESKGGLRISFRMLNITETSFFNTKLALFFLVDQRDVGSPLRDITEADLRNHGESYELLALLSFTDNRTSRTVEVSRSWRLNTAVWDETFVPIVRQSGPGSSRAFEIDVDNLSTTRVCF
ncbi:hypothetical protein, conserved [Eimeria praecox]|uniref:Inward rectifier potassium channel C-terminal domain-containing protein n=1 Tax=Eimeria praecox TaxID=51316 RepID=U6G7U5_9EIME|nr:hypothetical protein, conserved [Eimeria praecox]